MISLAVNLALFRNPTKMKKGSPVKVNPQKCKIQIYVTEEIAADLEVMGKKLYRSRPSLINEAILKYLEANNANKATTSDIA
jgi:hypothetical protein